MDRDYKKDAARFLGTLPEPGHEKSNPRTANGVIDQRLEEFPIFRDGIDARRAALKDRFGDYYGVVFDGNAPAVDIETGYVNAFLLIYKGKGQPDTSLAVEFAPGRVKLAGDTFRVGQEDALNAALDGVLRQYYL